MNRVKALWLCALCLAAPMWCEAADAVSRVQHGSGEILSSHPPTAAWDSLTQLDAHPSPYMRGPIVDSLGNAWVVIDNGTSLLAFQSNGAAGTWKPPHIIAPSLPSRTTIVGVAVDRVGGFYVTYGTGGPNSGIYPLLWTKYSPASGWQGPLTIHTSPTPFTQTFPSIDSAGRLVVVFNPNGIASIATNPAQTTWGVVQTIAPPPRSFRVALPSVASNKSGQRLALVYWVDSPGLRSRELRYTFFDSAAARWSESLAVPGSEDVTFSGYSVENAFPIAVDESGSVTVVCAIQKLLYTIAGFRYEGGQWTVTQLLPWSRSSPNPDNLGGVSISATGAVLVVVPTYASAGVTNVSVFRYTPGPGWSTEVAATYGSSVVSRSRVAWFNGSGAVVVYQDFSPPAPVLKAALHQNGTWTAAPAIPGSLASLYPGLATAPTGEVLLGMPVEGVGAYVTWLRP
jgi:hypothetical protein